MITNKNDYIPSYIINDLKNTSSLEISDGWVITNKVGFMKIYHERYGSRIFKENSEEYKIITNIINKTNKIDLNTSSLISLWTDSVIKIKSKNINEKLKTERFKPFYEYMKKFESTNISNFKLLERIFLSSISIIGAGGLGSSLAMLLASHGVGNIRITDGDTIEHSNLNRQLFYSENNIGERKSEVLKRRIQSNNKDINVISDFNYIKSYEDAIKATEGTDFVFLCADSPRFKIKSWVGQACYDMKIPLLIMSGEWVGPILFGNKSPCYACLTRHHINQLSDIKGFLEKIDGLHSLRPSFGVYPHILSGYFAAIAIHFLSGVDRETFLNKRLKFNLFSTGVEEHIIKYIDCPICGVEK